MGSTVLSNQFFGVVLVEGALEGRPEDTGPRMHVDEGATVDGVRLFWSGTEATEQLCVACAGSISTAWLYQACALPRYDRNDEPEMRRAVNDYLRRYGLVEQVNKEVAAEPRWLMTVVHR